MLGIGRSETPLSTQVNVDKLLADLKDCVQELSVDFANSSVPIDDDCVMCQRFCGKLEQFLQLGIQERIGILGRKKTYWDIFKACLVSKRGGVDSAIKFAKNNAEVHTSSGRGRAFVRYCLVHGCLGDALQQTLMTEDTLATWYKPTAPLRNQEHAQQLVALAYDLAEVHFDLAPGGNDLDSGWPTFARRQISTPYSWKPLSRSTSISSINSSFSTDPSSPPGLYQGGMQSLPEDQQQQQQSPFNQGNAGDNHNSWWGQQHPPHHQDLNSSLDQESQTDVLEDPEVICDPKMEEELANAKEALTASQSETSELRERLAVLESESESSKSLIKTELEELRKKYEHSEQERKSLISETQTLRLKVQDSDSFDTTLQTKSFEIDSLKDKLQISERECQRLKVDLAESQSIITAKQQNLDVESSTSELERLQKSLESTKAECESFKTQVKDLNVRLEKSIFECDTLRTQLDTTPDLRGQLEEARQHYEELSEKFKTEEEQWKNQMEQKSQQVKWEMDSLQGCVDNLLSENAQLRTDLTHAGHSMTESRDKFSTNELYAQKLTEQVSALKDVVSIGRQMLEMRDAEVTQLKLNIRNLEAMVQHERERNTILSESLSPDTMGNTSLKNEYESQLENIRALKTMYKEKANLMDLENEALKDSIVDKNRRLELMEKRFSFQEIQNEKLSESLKLNEKLVTELKSQLEASEEKNKALTNQLSMITKLFSELGNSEVDFDKLKDLLQDAVTEGLSAETSAEGGGTNLPKLWHALAEFLDANPTDPPQPVEGSEGCYKSINTPQGPRVVISVSQTFIRLKDLILEKKSLEKDLGTLRDLNGHLETKLHQQEERLSLVMSELKKTWGVVNKMRTQHSQLRTSETILRYDLQQKRKVVNELKEELEYCREIWQQARKKTNATEQQYRTLRDEFASRRRRPLVRDSIEMTSAESGYSDDRGEDDSGGSSDIEETPNDISEPSSPADLSECKTPENLSPDLSRPGSTSENDNPPADIEGMDAVVFEDAICGPLEPESTSKVAPGDEAQPSTSTGAIRKIVETKKDSEKDKPKVEEVSLPAEEVLDARSARLKRLEDECSQLFKKVKRTSDISVALNNRLDELHEQYGENAESRNSAEASKAKCDTNTVKPEASISTPSISTKDMTLPKLSLENLTCTTSDNNPSPLTVDFVSEILQSIKKSPSPIPKGLVDEASTSSDSPELPTSSEMSPTTGAIKKTSEPKKKDATCTAINLDETTDTSKTTDTKCEDSEALKHENSETQKPEEEVLDAKSLRLKRLEEQCNQLFQKVKRTSNISNALNNRLDELHEQYGENSENSARWRMRRSAETANIPSPPPLPPSASPPFKSPTVKHEEITTEVPESKAVETLKHESILPESLKPVFTPSSTSADTSAPALERRPSIKKTRNPQTEIPTPPPMPEFNLPPTVSTEVSTVSDKIKIVPGPSDTEIMELLQEFYPEELENIEELSEERDQLTSTLAEEAGKISALEAELWKLRLDLTNKKAEIDCLKSGCEDGIALLAAREEECSALRQQVDELSVQCSEVRSAESKLRVELATEQEISSSRQSQLEMLQGDVEQLTEAIIRITKQKDLLFKECYQLKQANKERWERDSQVVQCTACQVPFSLLVRRHHCRLCGRIYCGACSSHWVTQGETSRRSRSCSDCHSKHQQASSSSSPEKLPNSSSESSLTSSMMATEDDRPTASPVGGDESDGDEDFSVISEEEVVLSQCVPYSPNPEILQYWKSCEIQSGLSKSVPSLMAGEGCTESVWVRAGVIYTVPFIVEDSNVTVRWEFSTEPKCIAFSVLYKSDADIPTENSSILVPTTRVNSHLHPIKGRLRAMRDGVYTLMFDNSFSRITGKKVTFSLSCELVGSGRSSVGPESPHRAASTSPIQELSSQETQEREDTATA